VREIQIILNGDRVELAIRDSETLLEVLRDRLGLTGTKRGCDQGACGACTVLLDGRPILSCVTLAGSVDGREIITIEGLVGKGGELHPVQRAFHEVGAIQCGFCTPGMVLVAKSLLDRVSNPSSDEIREAISGNICRCTGYGRIVTAVEKAAVLMTDDQGADL
jgi:aerobic carbon-monoxide dehydrogenase small subunit